MKLELGSYNFNISFLMSIFFVLQLSEIVNQGKLVSDEIIINLLSKRLEAGESKGETGFILDGFPRTIRQAVSTSLIIVSKHEFIFIIKWMLAFEAWLRRSRVLGGVIRGSSLSPNMAKKEEKRKKKII